MRALTLLLLALLLLPPGGPLAAQAGYGEQVTAIEQLIQRGNYSAARAQAEALVQAGRQSQLPEVAARGHYLLGSILLADPAAGARQRVDGIRALQRAAEAFRGAGQRATVDSILAELQQITGSEAAVRIPALRELEATARAPETEIEESALSAIVSLQSRTIESLTDSQVRQLIRLERQQRDLDALAYEAANDSLLLLQQEATIDQREAELETGRQRRNFLLSIALAAFVILAALYSRYRSGQRYQARLRAQNEVIANERERSDNLLRNILPASVAEELKDTGKARARRFDNASVVFADFKGFSSLAATMEPEWLVHLLDEAFRAFDEIVARHGLEKIKTIGDAYMCVAGLPAPQADHAARATRCALEMQEYLAANPNFDARIGIHSGPVVAGVVGRDKFAYDIWGDTVNQAARLEAAGEIGRVSVSEATCALLGDDFTCERRGTFEAKNIGPMNRYVVLGPSAPVG